MTHLLRVCSIVAWIGASGCWLVHDPGEPHPEDPPSDGPPDDARLCEQVADVRAQAIAECCVSSPDLLEGVLDCERRRVRDEDAARRCLDEARIAGAACEEALFSGSCVDAFEGVVPEGGACGHDQECQPELRCIGAAAYPASCARLPEPQPLPGPGEPCDRGRCEAGTCHDDVCVAFGALGEACTPERPCAPDLRCLDGACQPYRQQGEPCADDDPCDVDLWCVRDECQPASAEGEPCGPDDGPCLPGLACSETTNLCARLEPSGEAFPAPSLCGDCLDCDD